MGILLSTIMVNLELDDEKDKAAAMKALKAQAIVLKGKSQMLCPVESGTLRDSCTIEEGADYVMVGYGGAATAYAAIQHENMSYHHPVGQAKFLEQPADEMEEQIKEAVKKAILGALR